MSAEAPAIVPSDRESVGSMANQAGARKKVRIAFARFWSGAAAEELIDTILPDLKPYYDFEISGSPQVLLYGPYSGDIPKGRFLKVFIGCENVRPIMSECDFAFGVEREESFTHPRYMRFARWGDDSHLLQGEKDWAAVMRAKTRFCAFIHANPVYYREAFFCALSRYKKVDAPGASMNNMPSIDPVPGRLDWNAKIEFLRNYKFVIAFENASRPGYNTEKLTHAIEADCLPIYWGDPEVERAFNVRRFINALDYLPRPVSFMPRLPYAPHSIRSTGRLTFAKRAARRLNALAGAVEQRTWALAGFGALVDRIAQIDRDDDLYLRHLREPFLIGNKLPDRSRWVARWRDIFEQSLS
jgi:alpha(1,3/1,4) fucosyltransferase